MKKLIALAILLAVAACGSFPLAGGTQNSTKTSEEHRLDLLECQHNAQMAILSAKQQSASFLLGMTIIGVPAAYEMERRTGRKVFKDCMETRGYTVTPVAQGPSMDREEVEKHIR